MVQRAQHDEKLSHRFADEDFVLGAYGSVVIAIWRRETKPDAVAALAAYIVERAGRYPGGVALLQIIDESATPPSGAARRALARMHSDQSAFIRRSALVYTKRGFAGAAVRAVMTGVAMLHPPDFEHELFASVRDAIPWIERDLMAEGAPPQSTSLMVAVEGLRATEKLSTRRDPPEVGGPRLKVLPPR